MRPISKDHLDDFMAHMNTHDFDELPDGAWFGILEEAAEQFMGERKIRRGSSNDAVHQYMEELNKN